MTVNLPRPLSCSLCPQGRIALHTLSKPTRLLMNLATPRALGSNQPLSALLFLGVLLFLWGRLPRSSQFRIQTLQSFFPNRALQPTQRPKVRRNPS